MSRADVSPKSSFTCKAITPAGRLFLNAWTPSLNFDQNWSLSFTLSLSSTLTNTMPSRLWEKVFLRLTSL